MKGSISTELNYNRTVRHGEVREMLHELNLDVFVFSFSRLYHDCEPAVLLREPAPGRGRGGREPGLHPGGCHLLPRLAGFIHIPHWQQRSVTQRQARCWNVFCWAPDFPTSSSRRNLQEYQQQCRMWCLFQLVVSHMSSVCRFTTKQVLKTVTACSPNSVIHVQ